MGLKFDDKQKDVIEAGPSERVWVDGGAGCGKTDVTCARIVRLIERGVEPRSILVISFARATIAELSKRMKGLSDQNDGYRGVRICTLDSEAFRVCKGFSEDAGVEDLFGSYERNIQAVNALLEEGNEAVADYFGKYDHVFIDEAQDITGIRATLVTNILKTIRPDCGVTLFYDFAQAIYNWTTDEVEAAPEVSESVLELADKNGIRSEFINVQFEKNYRTDSEKLLEVFHTGRALIGNRSLSGSEKLAQVRGLAEKGSVGKVLNIEDLASRGLNDLLILYRRRYEVIQASSLLYNKGIAHRLRVGRAPTMISPWVGAVLGGYNGPPLNREAFNRLWERAFSKHKNPILAGGLTRDDAWNLIFNLAGTEQGWVRQRDIRNALANRRPPVEFCLTEQGHSGPILGTIHSSKGREAEDVGLMLPALVNGDTEVNEEESRVIYVAATRPRKTLFLGDGLFSFPSRLKDSGRLFRSLKGEGPGIKVMVEFGLPGDFDHFSPVSFDHPGKLQGIREMQDLLADNVGEISETVATLDMKSFDYVLNIRMPGDTKVRWLGKFSQAVNQDLFSILKVMKQSDAFRPAGSIRHLQFFGVRTVVLREDDPGMNEIASEYRDTGIYLCPVIRGWTVNYFSPKRFRGRTYA